MLSDQISNSVWSSDTRSIITKIDEDAGYTLTQTNIYQRVGSIEIRSNDHMKTGEVIKLAKTREKNKIQEDFVQKYDNEIMNDVTCLKIAETLCELNDFLEENEYDKISVCYEEYVSDQCNKRCDAHFDERDTDLARIDSKYEEIKAIVLACDTYEQEMDILRAYGIVDTVGKMIV